MMRIDCSAVRGVLLWCLLLGGSLVFAPTTVLAAKALAIEDTPLSQAPTSIDQGSTKPQALPDLNAPVIDQSQTLSTADINQLETHIRRIYQAGRAQIGIVLVPSTQPESVFEYAMRIADQWQLGDAKRDNGLLMVVAVQDRRMQILSGYGLEGVLPDVVLSRLIREQITPAFRNGDYVGGLEAGLTTIDQILQLDPETAQAQAHAAQEQDFQQQQQTDTFGSILPVLFILLFVGQGLRWVLGRFLASALVGAVGTGIAWFMGSGLVGALIMGGILFVLLLVGITPLLSGGRSTGGFGGGGFSSGGYRGGGGGFGGGGASGSW